MKIFYYYTIEQSLPMKVSTNRPGDSCALGADVRNILKKASYL